MNLSENKSAPISEAEAIEDKEDIKKLERALFYEVQYRYAVLAGAISYYDINLSKDLIENDFFFKTEFNTILSVPEYVGLKIPCKFTDFIQNWTAAMVTEETQRRYHNFSDIREVLLKAYNDGKLEYNISYWARRKNGKNIFLSQRFLLTKNEKGDVCALAIVKDFTETVSIEEQLHQKEIERYAYFDSVTDGYNYIKFKDVVNRHKSSGVIIAVDVHSFKVINSICGVRKGDEILKIIWNCIFNAIEPDKEEVAAHINADHFIIFLPTYDSTKIKRKLKNITYALNMTSIDMKIPQLQPYFGISFWEPGKRIELSYSNAVSAKHNARDLQDKNYAYFEEEDTQRLVQEKEMADNFDLALLKKEFKIWYQPKFNPMDRNLVGAEALVRWQKEDGTMIPPGKFIPVFERNGMISVLDEYMFKNVCEQQKKWLTEGKNIVPVSINLSRASLYYPKLVEKYSIIASNAGIETKYIPIEITESAAVNNSDIKKIADKFYNAGFILHMDDFGSGYSSLASLNMLHFDTLKLDKSLIDFIGNFSGDRLIEHTISLAKDLGIHVTAEGVENEKQVTFLNHMSCDSIQGYYFSKPITQEDFSKMLADYSSRQKVVNDTELVNRHINQFRQNINKTPVYTFVANLTKNDFTQVTGGTEWAKETKIFSQEYDASIYRLATEYIDEDFKQSYLHFMNREYLIENFGALPQTRIFQYRRLYNGEPIWMQMFSHEFKIETSDDVYCYITVTILN